MGLGSQNKATQKTFYSTAGGQTKWKLLIQTQQQAKELIEKIWTLPNQEKRVERLQAFIKYKDDHSGDTAFKVHCTDCGAKLYEEAVCHITLAEFEGIHCQRKPKCQ